MKTNPQQKPKTTTQQPTAETMKTTTKQAAEQKPATQDQPAAEPQPAYAFSLFAKTRPALQEIGAITGKSFEEIKWQGHEVLSFFSFRLKEDLRKIPQPRPTSDIAFVSDRVAPLKEQLRNADLSHEEAEKIQRRILDIIDAPQKPVRDHQEKIARLSAAIDTDLEAFKDWLANDPAGIAARAADEAHSEWERQEKRRLAAEAKEAERKARAEQFRAKCKEEAFEMSDEIGSAIAETEITHPDIDGQVMQDFIGWFTENNRRPHDNLPRMNAILTGPPGVGKSRALASAALAYCDKTGREGIEWITGYEFADLISNLSTDKRDESTARLQAITEADSLFFDDLGSANFTTARTSRFFRLVDERYRRRLPTFISTNYSTAQLKKLFTTTGETKDEAVRILRRIIGTPAHPLATFFHFKRPQGQ
jgi:DNA replication protein DnaC